MAGRVLAKAVYGVTSREPLSSDYALRNQMRWAAVWVVSNVSEGFDRDGSREFQQFLSVAKGSAGELRGQAYVALDTVLMSREEFEGLVSLCEDVSAMSTGMMRYLARTSLTGRKRMGGHLPQKAELQPQMHPGAKLP